jgi:tRNA threonylcarbamoyl adenosine modification protein YjeE
MRPPKRKEFDTRSAEDTVRFGQALAPLLSAGDTVLLSGEVGAGKSVLARAIIQFLMEQCGAVEDVPSPTFTLVQTYALGDLTVWHADLYRLGDMHDVQELGLEEAFGRDVCLVEWPDRLGSSAPADALTVQLAMLPDRCGRAVELAWSAEKWDARIAAVLQATDG